MMRTKYLTNQEKDQIGEVLVEKANQIGREAHKDQVRKYTGLPYFTHPERVRDRVKLYTRDYNVIAACPVHDVKEDCPWVSLKTLYEELGVAVVNIVIELTNPSKDFPNLNRAARKEMDRNYLTTVSADAQLIKVIDRIDNLRDMVNAPDDFKKLYKAESVALAQVLKKAPPGLVEELIRLATLEKPDND